MIHRGQWVALAGLLSLVLVIGAMHVHARLPSGNYIDAMAKGQYSRAGEFLQAEVEAGNPQAQTALANLYYLGLGHEPDYRRSAELYHAAAIKGFAAAQMNLGHLYKQGLGVMKNAERAFGWYTHANIAGSPWAEFYLSQISVELTITPLQMSVVKIRWRTLEMLAAEPL